MSATADVQLEHLIRQRDIDRATIADLEQRLGIAIARGLDALQNFTGRPCTEEDLKGCIE